METVDSFSCKINTKAGTVTSCKECWDGKLFPKEQRMCTNRKVCTMDHATYVKSKLAVSEPVGIIEKIIEDNSRKRVKRK